MKRGSSLRSRLGTLAVGASLALGGCIQLPNPIDNPPFVDDIPRGPSPSFGQTVSQADPPPPLSGGTLLMTRDGTTAVAADPDRDRVVLVDIASRQVRSTIALARHAEPGRAVEDSNGRVHVVLRTAGEVADIDPASGKLLDRRAVCPAPRGIAVDKGGLNLLVACAGGELVTLPVGGGAVTRSSMIERDLRDVVVDADGTVMVTRLRTAEVLVLGVAGAGGDFTVKDRSTPSTDVNNGSGTFVPNTAFRAVALPGGGMVMAHQRSSGQPVQITAGGYGGGQDRGGCGIGGAGIVHSTATVIRHDAWGLKPGRPAPILAGVVLPVDVAALDGGHEVAVLSAGNAYIPGASQVSVTSAAQLENSSGCEFSLATAPVTGEAIALAYHGSGDLYVQTREPATLQIVRRSGSADASAITIPLGGESRFDTGFAVFHSNSSAGLACASCHAEGGDDARTWEFADLGPRRTQSLRGGITGRAPFHWSGDEADFTHLVTDVFVGRMSGPELDLFQSAALLHWVDTIPTLPAPALSNASAVARGQQLFNDPVVACASCHTGAKLTNNRKVDVGTSSVFKTPSLVNLANHAPYMHDGCAGTLLARFGACGGGDKHGHTSQLTPAQLQDLVAYLETL